MKRIRIYLLIISLLMICAFAVSCDYELDGMEINSEAKEYSVIFTVDGKTVESKIVEGGRAISKPSKEPSKENHRFLGWYTEDGERYDFSSHITKSITLCARFEFDMETLKEDISKLKYSIVKVQNKSFNSEDMSDSDTENGVGVIFNISNGHCFLITTNHTIAKKNGYANQKLTVEDYTGAVHDALFYQGSNKPQRAASSEYDLAVICFPYTRSDLKVASFKENTPKSGDTVVSIGDSIDKVSVGEVTEIDTKKVDIEEYLSNVEFKVIHHNAVSDDICEGILFNLNEDFVGITYATENGEAYTIPYSKVVEFFNIYVYN